MWGEQSRDERARVRQQQQVLIARFLEVAVIRFHELVVMRFPDVFYTVFCNLQQYQHEACLLACKSHSCVS